MESRTKQSKIGIQRGLTCWHVKNRAANTKVPAIPCANFVCRKMGSEGAAFTTVAPAVVVETMEEALFIMLAATMPTVPTVVLAMITATNKHI